MRDCACRSFTGDDKIESKEPGGQEARKTLTNLLLKSDTGEFQSFGFQVQQQLVASHSFSRAASIVAIAARIASRAYGAVVPHAAPSPVCTNPSSPLTRRAATTTSASPTHVERSSRTTRWS